VETAAVVSVASMVENTTDVLVDLGRKLKKGKKIRPF
jgi:aspartokinase